MKKIYVILIILIQISVSIYSQDSLSFKSKFSPKKKYKQIIEQNSNLEFEYLGSDEFLENLNNKGLKYTNLN